MRKGEQVQVNHFPEHFFGVTGLAAPDPRHPLSQAHPTDIDFNMSNYRIFNVSELKLNPGSELEGLVLNNLSITTEGGAQELCLDYSNDEWDIINSDINLNGNNLNNLTMLKQGDRTSR